MKKDDFDRIIVDTNEKMKRVIVWYMENREWIDKEEFKAPMESGLIVLQEEKLEVSFESKGSVVELSVYKLGNQIPVMVYDYDPITMSFSNYRFPKNLPAGMLQLLKKVSQTDKTDLKEAIKYHSLMMFAAYYKEVVTIDTEQSQTRTKKEAKKLRKSSSQPLPLVRKTYVVKEFDTTKLKKPKERKKYQKPEQEVEVRGHYRTYQNGKRIWIKSFSKYKEKGNKKRKEYKL